MTIIIGPYSHKNTDIKKLRLQKIADACNFLMRNKHTKLAVSPLLYGISIIDNSSKELPDSMDYWDEMCVEFVNMANEVIVLNLEGWDESVGVKIEIEKAKKLNIPIYLVDYETCKHIKIL